jgi:hypothetical protein
VRGGGATGERGWLGRGCGGDADVNVVDDRGMEASWRMGGRVLRANSTGGGWGRMRMRMRRTRGAIVIEDSLKLTHCGLVLGGRLPSRGEGLGLASLGVADALARRERDVLLGTPRAGDAPGHGAALG